MTISASWRDQLKRWLAQPLSDRDAYQQALHDLARAVPALLDEIDRLERNLRGTDDTLDVVRKASMERGLRADDLGIRLHVATELNVGDRKRIAALETELGEAKLVIEQQDRDLEKLRAALGEALVVLTYLGIARALSDTQAATVERLRKVLG